MKTEVLMFKADGWCTSCHKLAPTFREIAKELQSDNFVFKEVEVEDDDGVDLSTKYQVRNVPTILVIKKDRVVERITGTRTKNELKGLIEKWK